MTYHELTYLLPVYHTGGGDVMLSSETVWVYVTGVYMNECGPMNVVLFVM